MPGPDWSSDAPHDTTLIASNAAALLTHLHAGSSARTVPTAQTVQEWHSRLYAGCTVPDPAYVGKFRGDPAAPSLVGYEVGVGPMRADGHPEGVGVWSEQIESQTGSFFGALNEAFTILDDRFPQGVRPSTPADLQEVVALAAVVHGEWIRIHPFANGTGRTARVWAAFIAFRYGLPAFVRVQPRPAGVLYTRAATSSMGRPPDFIEDHTETIAVFARWLRLTAGA